MGVAFNVDEIISIGIEIEKNGHEFYTKAARNAKLPSVKKLLETLASWEKEHLIAFDKIKKGLPSETDESGWYADEQAHGYFKAAADSHVFVKNSDIDKLVNQCENELQVLEMALTFEKDSVVLYQTLGALVNPAFGGKAELEEVIKEELMHISVIQEHIQEQLRNEMD